MPGFAAVQGGRPAPICFHSPRQPDCAPECAVVRISDFSKTTTLGNWSADILVRSRSSVNPEADRNVRAGAGQNSSRAISHQSLAEVKGGRCDMWETPRASFIPAQGNALGSSAPKPISAESAIHPSSYQPPASHSASVPNVSFIELYEAGRWPIAVKLRNAVPGTAVAGW